MQESVFHYNKEHLWDSDYMMESPISKVWSVIELLGMLKESGVLASSSWWMMQSSEG